MYMTQTSALLLLIFSSLCLLNDISLKSLFLILIFFSALSVKTTIVFLRRYLFFSITLICSVYPFMYNNLVSTLICSISFFDLHQQDVSLFLHRHCPHMCDITKSSIIYTCVLEIIIDFFAGLIISTLYLYLHDTSNSYHMLQIYTVLILFLELLFYV